MGDITEMGLDEQTALGGCSSSGERWKGFVLGPGLWRGHFPFPLPWKSVVIQICLLGSPSGVPPREPRCSRAGKGGICWDPTLGGPCHPPTPVFSTFYVVIDGLFQQKSKILPGKRLPHLALTVPWAAAEILFDLDLFS